MGLVRGTWKQGQIVLDEPAPWPDGTRVEVEPLDAEATVGFRDEDWPTDAERIAALLARMDTVESVEMSPEEEADIEAWCRKVRNYTIARMDERSEGCSLDALLARDGVGRRLHPSDSDSDLEALPKLNVEDWAL